MAVQLFASLLCLLSADAPAKAVENVDLQYLRTIDAQGVIHRLGDNEERLGSVFVFLPPQGPVVDAYVPELNRLVESTPKEKISVFGIVSDPKVRRAAASQLAKQTLAKFPMLFDGDGELAEKFQPTNLPEAFLVDAKGRVVYRGRIDDRIAADGKLAAAASKKELEASVAELMAGKPVAVPRAPATAQAFDSGKAAGAEITFSRHIAPILFSNCTECHRPKQVAPFALISYDDAAKRAKSLAEATQTRLMPPWRAEIGYGHFADERRLTDRQRALIKQWADAGAPKGNDADAPSLPLFPEGWRLGEPDVVVEAPVPFTVPATGPDIFQHFVLPVKIPEDKMLVGFEFKPGNAKVVHHAVIFLDATGGARAKDESTPEPGFRTSGSVEVSVTALVGVWTPGMTPRYYPKGIGVPMPKQVDIVLQLHLHPSGKEEIDQSSVALHFSDQPAAAMQSQNMLLMGNIFIDIPVGANRHKIGASITLPVDLTLLSVFPHLHLIGKEMKATATLPNGEQKPLIWIKDWNFYWQDSYFYQQPVLLPKGTKLEVEAYYDNSSENPFNPSSPPRRVLFGNGSTDEMCFAFFQVVGDRKSMGRMAPAMMQSFLAEYRKVKLDDEARDHIIDEAGKLFGRRGGDMLKQMLSISSKPTEKKSTETPRPQVQ